MKKSVKAVCAVLIIVILAATVFFALRADRAAEEEAEAAEAAGSVLHAELRSDRITYCGTEYPIKRRLKTVLVVGTDKFNEDKLSHEAFYNFEQADFIGLLVFDIDSKTVTPVQINRDTMCDVPWLSVNGLVGGYKFCQIALSHTYGTGSHDSCVNTANAVSKLLFGAPVDYYMVFTMNAVPLINDLVGGVPVTMEEDMTDIDPSFTAGAEVVLKGNKALRFVRTRDISLLDSNNARMHRQRQYLAGFTAQAKNAYAVDEKLVNKLQKILDDYVCTNMNGNNITDMVSMLNEYDLKEVMSPEGEYVMGTQFAEYYVDENSLFAVTKAAFCNA